jgi:tetratricopeptide (TPR) repeat protein
LQKLRIAIPEVLMKKEVQETVQKNGLYLKWLIRQGFSDLAEEELVELLKKQEKAEDVDGMEVTTNFLIDLQIHHKLQTLPAAEKNIEDCKKRIELLKHRAIIDIRKEEIRLKHLERVMLSFKTDYFLTPFTDSISFNEVGLFSSLAQYLRERAAANVAMGEEKIFYLKRILAQPELIEKYEDRPKEWFCRIYVNIALEYYLAGNYANASEYFELAYTLVNEVTGPVREVLIYNYLYCLIKEGNFDVARQLSEMHQNELKKSGILGKKASLAFTMIYLSENQPDKAKKFLDLDEKQNVPEFHYSMRLANAAILYGNGKTEEALRECLNVDQAVNYMLRKDENSQIRLIKECSTTFSRFFKILLENTDQKMMKDQLKTLLLDLKKIMANEGKASTYGSVLNIWIAREASRKINYR